MRLRDEIMKQRFYGQVSNFPDNIQYDILAVDHYIEYSLKSVYV